MQEVFAAVADLVGDIGNALVEAVKSLANFFYTPGAEGAAGSLTIAGWVVAAVIGIGVISFVISWVMRMIGRVRVR